MQKILVLFNLQAGVSTEDYERWARSTDLPIARALNSVHQFKVYRAEGMFGTDETPPYQYAEWLEVTGVDELAADAQSEAMAAVAKAFGTYADNPQFVLMNNIE